jgi:hypothetical protein
MGDGRRPDLPLEASLRMGFVVAHKVTNTPSQNLQLLLVEIESPTIGGN